MLQYINLTKKKLISNCYFFHNLQICFALSFLVFFIALFIFYVLALDCKLPKHQRMLFFLFLWMLQTENIFWISNFFFTILKTTLLFRKIFSVFIFRGKITEFSFLGYLYRVAILVVLCLCVVVLQHIYVSLSWQCPLPDSASNRAQQGHRSTAAKRITFEETAPKTPKVSPQMPSDLKFVFRSADASGSIKVHLIYVKFPEFYGVPQGIISAPVSSIKKCFNIL